MVQFVSELSQSQNQIQNRRPPEPDRSGLIMAEAYKDAISSVGSVVQGLDESNLSAAKVSLDERLQQEVVEPSLGNLQTLQNGVAQGRITRGEATVRAEAELKKAIAQNPRYAVELRAYARDKLGFNPTQSVLEQAFQEESDIENLKREVQSQAIKDAEKTGDAVYDNAGNLDVEQTMANHQVTQSIEKRAAANKAAYEQNKITKEQADTKFEADYMATLGHKTSTVINNILNKGIQVGNAIVPLAQVPEDQLAAAISSTTTQLKVALNNSLSQSGLAPERTKALQERTDVFVKDVENMFLGASKAELEQMDVMIKKFNNQTEISFQQKAPLLAQQRVILGTDGNSQAMLDFVLDPKYQQERSKQVNNFFTNQGLPAPSSAKDPQAIATNTIDNVQQAAVNPVRMVQMKPEEVITASPAMVQYLRNLQKAPNNMSEKNDKAFSNYSTNFANYGLTRTPDEYGAQGDAGKLVSELTSPLWSNTFNAVKARQVDAAVIERTGTKVNQFLEKSLVVFKNNVKKIQAGLLTPETFESGTFTPGQRLDDEGNIVSGVTVNSKTLPAKYKIVQDAAGNLALQPTTTPKKQTIRGREVSGRSGGVPEIGLTQINRTINTMVKLKEYSPYASLSDSDYRAALINSLELPGFNKLQVKSVNKPVEVLPVQTQENAGQTPLAIPTLPDLEGTQLDKSKSTQGVSEFIDQNESAPFGFRQDGTPKGSGFLGVLKRPDGGVSTELSIGVNIDGKETEIPSLVPTLSKEEVNYLLKGNKPTPDIVKKAVAHAKQRMAEGKSVFAN